MARKSKATSSKKKSGKIGLDFTGVQTRVMLPENDYLLSVTSLEEEDESVIVGLKIEKGKFEGKTVKEYFSTKPQALWRFGNFIAACGLEVPDGPAEIDASDFADVKVMGVCTHEEYEGKTKMRWDFYGADEADESDDDEDGDDDNKSSGKKSGGKKAKKLDREEVEAMDRDELGELIDEHELDVDPDSKKLKKDDDKLLAAVIAALEEKELLDAEDGDDDEDDDEKDSKKSDKKSSKKGGKKKAEKIASSDVEDMDEDELEKLVEEHELDVELGDHKTLRKKVRAVLDALEEKDLLEE